MFNLTVTEDFTKGEQSFWVKTSHASRRKTQSSQITRWENIDFTIMCS